MCFAALLLPAGAIADRFGRRRVFQTGISIFAVASLLCGLASSAAMLYLSRAVQGIGAAFLLAPALAIIGHTFRSEIDRNQARGIWGGMMGFTMVLSPVIGGVIAYVLGWWWAFNINIPICLLLIAAVAVFADESRDADARRLDPVGILSFSASDVRANLGIGWGSSSAVYGFCAGALSFVIFVAAESVLECPMLDLTLFRFLRFVGAVLAMFAYAGCAQVMASLLPPFLQNGVGRTPLATGPRCCPSR